MGGREEIWKNAGDLELKERRQLEWNGNGDGKGNEDLEEAMIGKNDSDSELELRRELGLQMEK